MGWFVIRISRPRLRVLMLSNPLNRVMLGNEALDCFRFAIGPQNIDPPARAGIFPRHESWSLLGHPLNMRLWEPGSRQSSCHNHPRESVIGGLSGAGQSVQRTGEPGAVIRTLRKINMVSGERPSLPSQEHRTSDPEGGPLWFSSGARKSLSWGPSSPRTFIRPRALRS